jgi:hypothetical protein
MLHPEVIGIGAYSSEGLFERDLDFEAQTVNPDNFKGWQGQISAHKYAPTSYWMDHGHEAHRDAEPFDQEISTTIPNLNPMFPIDRAFRRVHSVGAVKERFEGNFLSILFWPSFSSFPGWSISRQIRNGGDSHLRYQMVVLPKKACHDFSGRIVRIGDEVKRGQTEAVNKQKHLVQEGF